MDTLRINKNPQVEEKFATYPDEVKMKLSYLRQLILETASENDTIREIEETLKWGEPSYIAKKGSTIRINWAAKNPDQYAMYFKCTSNLVPTFKAVFGDIFQYEKNRAIVFDMEDEVPKAALKECIELALIYHTVRQKLLLSAS